MNTLKERLALALAGPPKRSQAALARACGVKAPSVSGWLSGETKNLEATNLLAAAKFLGVSADWLANGTGSMTPAGNAAPTRYRIAESNDADDGKAIELSQIRGSCGGGSVSWDEEQRQPLIKESSWFRRYNIKPEFALAVWADGDSMADFIVDGDIAIFDKKKTTPKSGCIFLIDHPDGLRIKRLRRDIDGSWILESDNRDKHRFPDERVSIDQADLLKIVGQFVYRQGG